MPRIGRAVLPDYPHHIIQRGHNPQVVFVEAGDFERYLGRYGVRPCLSEGMGSGLAFCLLPA